MSPPPSPTDRSLLDAARAAIAQSDFRRAEALYLQHLEGARADAIGLAEYGGFCLRTGHFGAARYLLAKANALRPGDTACLVQLGYARLESPDAAGAREAFEAALVPSPDEAPAHYGLGLCHEREGAWTAATAAYRKALERSLAPGDAFPILLKLAEASHRAGDDATARHHFAQAAGIAPDDPALLLAHARFLRESGDAAAAMAEVDRGGRRTPNEPRLILEKARCLRALGEPAQARRWLEKLEQLVPGRPDTHAEYGYCLPSADERAQRERHWIAAIEAWTKAGDFGQAQALLDPLLEEDPASAAGWNARGAFENARQRPEAAEAAWRRAIACDPARLDAAANLALLLEGSNRLDEAEAIAQDAARRLPEGQAQVAAVELHLVLARLARRRRDKLRALDHLARIDALGPDDRQRRHAGFERGKLLDAQGDAAGAVAAFALGNRLAQASWQRANPGRNKALAGVEYMIDLVGKGWLRSWRPVEPLPPHRELAFLVGFPRSGTTLLNQVLDAHPAIHAIEEKPTVQTVMDAVQAMPGGYPHALAALDAFDVDWLRDAYGRAVAALGDADPAKLLLDKFPMNTTLAGLLHRVFPQARFVFALRHPCDVVLSCVMQDFELNNTMANFGTLADAVGLYVRTMELWQAYREQLPLSVHVVRYEDVVDDFDGQVAALCGFLGVEWRDGLRDFSAKALARGRIHTPSYEQVSRPIYREARYRWERYREFLEPHLPALRPWIEKFGYAEGAGLS